MSILGLFGTLLRALAVVLSLCATAHAAGDRGWYMGGGWGVATYNHDGAYDFPEARLDDRDGSTQIYGGYRFFRYFAVDGRFTDLGDYQLDDGETQVSFQFSSWSFHGLGIYPFADSGFDIYGHLGFGALFREFKVEVEGEDCIKVEQEECNDRSQNTGLLSAGAALRFTPKSFPSVTFLLGYDWYTFDADINGNALDQGFKVTKLALQYNFSPRSQRVVSLPADPDGAAPEPLPRPATGSEGESVVEPAREGAAQLPR